MARKSTESAFETRTRAEGEAYVITECCDFLEDLLDDEIVVWVAGARGGWYYREFGPSGPMPRRGLHEGTWAAPIGEPK